MKFSKRSLSNLEKVHPQLQWVVHSALATGIMDFSVVEGMRTIEKQRKYLANGVSKTLDSKHLKQDDGYSHAVDLYPYPIDMERVNKNDPREIYRFGVLSGIMLSCAKELGVEIINGADWDGDGETLDHSFTDMPHFELKGAK